MTYQLSKFTWYAIFSSRKETINFIMKIEKIATRTYVHLFATLYVLFFVNIFFNVR